MKLEVSIIIVNWNTSELLKKCLESIHTKTRQIRYEVIVVDNASKDGSADMVRQYFPDVRLIENHENVGFGRANNQALAYCTGEYLLLLNPDTEFTDNVLKTVIAFMRDHESVGLVGPKCIHPDGTIQVSWAQFPSLKTIFTNNVPWTTALAMIPLFKKILRSEAVYTNRGFTVDKPIPAQSVDYVLGQFMLTRTDVIKRIGLFDNDVFMYEEEPDLCYRLKQNGFETWFLPDAEIIHHERQSIDQLPNALEEEMDWFLSARGHFYRKHYGLLKQQLFYGLMFINSIFKMMMFSVMLLDRTRKQYFRKKQYFHYYIVKWFLKGQFFAHSH